MQVLPAFYEGPPQVRNVVRWPSSQDASSISRLPFATCTKRVVAALAQTLPKTFPHSLDSPFCAPLKRNGGLAQTLRNNSFGVGDANGGYQRRIPGAKGGAWQKNVRMTDLIDTGPACCVAQGVVEDSNDVFCAQGCKG